MSFKPLGLKISLGIVIKIHEYFNLFYNGIGNWQLLQSKKQNIQFLLI